MRLARIKNIIDDCERHLKASGAENSEISSYLTQHGLVVLCADIQQEIYRIFENRAAQVDDAEIFNFVSNAGRRVLRSVRKDDISKTVAMFGPHVKSMLNASVDDSDVTIYNNAVNDRHDVAHRNGAQLTFQELKGAVIVAEKILNAIDTSLLESKTRVSASNEVPLRD